MGQITFEVPPDLPPDRRVGLSRAWFAGGYDGSPVPTRRTDAPHAFTLRRQETESGYLCVPWRGADGTERVVSSATLRLTDTPYPALRELARGAVNRVRTMHFALASAGLKLPNGFADDLARLTAGFGRVVSGAEPTTAFAVTLVDTATALADRAATSLAEYRLTARHQHHGPLPTRVGSRLSRPLPPDQAELYLEAFNAVRVVPDWRAIEPHESATDWTALDELIGWADHAGLDVTVGPLIDLADGTLPDWVAAYAGDLPNLAAFVSDYAHTLMSRYRDRVRGWHTFAGFNHADVFGLVEDDRLRLAARVLETAQELDPKGDRSFAVSQPWGDYLTNEDLTYSPLVFADTLLRAGLKASAVKLEVIPGAARRGGERRDALDLVHLIELFDTLGLPLEAAVTGPGTDLFLTALAAPSMRAVYWDTWSAADPCSRVPAFPLVTPDGTPTPTLTDLRILRQRWLA